jgi:agmatinase
MPTFDPDAAAQPGSGIFGLPFTADESRVVLLPVPFDATTSYGGGASRGPAAIRAASAQVDLHDPVFGDIYRRGIFMHDESHAIRHLSERARALAAPIIERGGPADTPDDAHALATVNAAGDRVNEFVHAEFAAILAQGKTPGLIGGDHSTPFGAIQACAEFAAAADAVPGGLEVGETTLGILHLDAHMDLRDAFEGFAWSHASIMHNVMTRIPQVSHLVQIGIRDTGRNELDFAQAHRGRISAHHDHLWARALMDGARFTDLVRAALEPLPKLVYISFDIDALDPSLCPHTGTPVPGGLSFHQAATVLELLAQSGRTVVGFDLVEVTPGPRAGEDEPEWDANVGARILYKLCGTTR